MNTVMQRMSKYTDMIAAVFVVIVIVMMIVPLPPFLIDLLIAANISMALAIVIMTLYVKRALEFSVFPSLLLLTTLLRLAINVSVTRLILLHGDAGHMVESFGDFVVGGNVVVGLIIFLVLVVIQFVVVTNGAGRVAEVAARFTLDAMPGKQMAIDADLNAGQITEEQARERRQTWPAKPTSTARWTAPASSSRATRSRDRHHADQPRRRPHRGRRAAGHGVRRSGAALLPADGRRRPRRADPRAPDLGGHRHHGHPLRRRGRRPRHRHRDPVRRARQGRADGRRRRRRLRDRAGPPKVPFLIVGAGLFFLGRQLGQNAEVAAAEAAQAEANEIMPVPQPSSTDQARAALAIDPLELVVGFGLVPLVDQQAGGTLVSRVSNVRRQIAGELGTVIPPVRIHDEVGLRSHEYALRVRGAEVARGQVLAGHQLALDPGDAVGQLSGVPTTEPAFGLPAVWIGDESQSEAEALGYTVVDTESVIVTHLTEVIRRHVADLLTRQDTKQLLDGLKEVNAAVVDEVVPDLVSVGEIQRVLQALLREGVSIRDLGAIIEAIGDRARVTRDPNLLAEYARQTLGRAIVGPHLDEESRLRAIALDPAIEQEVADAITATADGEYLAMEPSRAQALVQALQQQSDQPLPGGSRPVLLCSSRIRRHLRRLVEQSVPQLPVCAYTEVAPGVTVETVGVVHP